MWRFVGWWCSDGFDARESVSDVVVSRDVTYVSPKTAITTSFGLFEFPFMSFGLHNAAQMFQCFMDNILSGLDFCFTYSRSTSDIYGFSST
jgi:hypothetical protein